MKSDKFMRTGRFGGLIMLIMWLLLSCDNTPGVPDPDPEVDISLDELSDMSDYPEGMVVDSRFFEGKRTLRIVLNDTLHKDPVSLDLSRPGYYRMEIFTGKSGEKAGVIRVVVLDPERGNTEWGLAPWTPGGVEFTEIQDQDIRLIYPAQVPWGSDIPLVAVVDGQLTSSLESFEASAKGAPFRIKRGVGSVCMPPFTVGKETVVIGHRSFPLEMQLMDASPLILGGTLEGDVHIDAGSLVHISSDLIIPAGSRLSVDHGVYVKIDPAVNIHNAGTIICRGDETRPIVIVCSDSDYFWGGIIGKGEGNLLEASHTIFSGSGYHAGSEYDWGHAHRQALFYTHSGTLKLDHCYMIDHIGQISYSELSSIQMDYCLVQRAMTGGQLNSSQVQIDHCVFTDFPDDSFDYQDEDNDGLYLVDCVARISHSFFMYARDDGLDSGGGLNDGDVLVRNSRFESIFHEGAALSGGTSAGKKQRFVNCVFQDCGQGIELGFSSRAHLVEVDSCLFLANGVGIRYGDNYTYPNQGYIRISDSESRDNVLYDVWNMDREDWVADTLHMEFSNVGVTKANPMYPQLKLLDP